MSTGPTAFHEVPYPLGAAEVRDGSLVLSPALILRPLLGRVSLLPSEIQRVELMDTSPGYQFQGMRLILVEGRGYCVWAPRSRATPILDWLKSKGIGIEEPTIAGRPSSASGRGD